MTDKAIADAAKENEAEAQGWIVFSSFHNKKMGVYAMRPDGSRLTRLKFPESPTFSGDGKQAAFSRGDMEKDAPLVHTGAYVTNIFLARFDGSRPSRLTLLQHSKDKRWGDMGYRNFSPNFSPDGKKVVFTNLDAYYPTDNSAVYVINTDGSNLKQLTRRYGLYPSFSPDGKKIIYVAPMRNKQPDSSDEQRRVLGIFAMNADGTKPVRLTQTGAGGTMPSYSPDGTKIVFASERITAFNEIYVMNADGTEQTRLTRSDRINESNPHFSPDGSKIVFEAEQLDQRDSNNRPISSICVMNADGTHLTKLTEGSDPQWVKHLPL